MNLFGDEDPYQGYTNWEWVATPPPAPTPQAPASPPPVAAPQPTGGFGGRAREAAARNAVEIPQLNQDLRNYGSQNTETPPVPPPGPLPVPGTPPQPAPTSTQSDNGNYSASNSGLPSTPAGFDEKKWHDLGYGSEKYAVGRIIAKGGSIQEAANAIGATVLGKDTIRLKNGEVYDVIQDEEGAHLPQWGLVGGGQGSGGGIPTPPAAPGGDGGRRSSVADFMNAGYQFGGPGDAGVFPSDQLQQVGQDPLSILTTGALATLLANGGRLSSPTGDKAYAALDQLLGDGGGKRARLESIREEMARLQRTQMNDARGELASRNLLSEGSIAQGPEMSTLGRINADIAPIWAGAARDAMGESDQNLLSTIQVATGLDQQAVQNLLSTVTTIGDRQEMLSAIALRTLEDNMAWNKFLAEFGLQRDTIMYQLENGDIEQLMPLIYAFIQSAGLSAGGYV